MKIKFFTLKIYIILLISIFIGGLSTGFFITNKNTLPLLINYTNLPLNSFASTDTNKINNGLVSINEYDPSIVVDLRYASKNNFLNEQIYPFELALLQKDTLKKLKAANTEFKKYGYRIKVWDAYRPTSVQNLLWSKVPDTRFIASPNKNGSRHNRGAAVDITLVNEDGIELEMPTDFDEFTEAAYRNSPLASNEAKENANFLCEIMMKHGFNPIETEWWHFDDSNADNYPLLDVTFEDLL